jgi:tRNA (guanine37-N1)-methyltransferase
MLPKSFDILGNIAILKFDDESRTEKIKIAKEVLEHHKSVETILEKTEKVKGRLRTIKTSHLAGKKNKVAFYRENNCFFKFDIDKTYFSPRLSNERKEIAEQVKKGEKVLVLFAGVGPFSIVIGKNSDAEKVYSVEINREASKFAEENVVLNKLENVEVVQGDVKKIIPKKFSDFEFDRVVMPRPQLKDSFLESALKVIKKKGIVNYYGFADTPEEVVEIIEEDCKKAGKKIKILLVKKAGDIAPFRYRWRVDFRVLN